MTQLKTIEKKIIPLVQEAKSLNITSQPDLEIATEILSQLNNTLDAVTTERERVTKPLNEALKAERSRWRPFEDQLNEAIASIRLIMTKYATTLTQSQKAQEQAIADRVASGKGNLSLESAMKRMEKIEKLEKETATDQGLVQFVETKRFEIIDKSKIPLDYLIPDEVAIRKAMKEGVELQGVRYFTEMTPRNYR